MFQVFETQRNARVVHAKFQWLARRWQHVFRRLKQESRMYKFNVRLLEGGGGALGGNLEGIRYNVEYVIV